MAHSGSPPCRLAVILAREAPRAAVLRRGPTTWMRLSLWHTDTDVLEHGQWFKGRIHAAWSDLSPDGALFLYAADKINSHTLQDTEYTARWTAISRPPWLTALALWPGRGNGITGGLFADGRTVWLAHAWGIAVPRSNHRPRGLAVIQKPELVHLSSLAYHQRLLRDGWVLTQQGVGRNAYARFASEHPWTWVKGHSSQPFNIVMKARGEDMLPHRDAAFSVLDQRNNDEVPIGDATWVDWDQNGRLVFTREGRLFAADGPNPPTTARMIADFNGQQPEPLVAPEWARQW